MKRYRAQPGTKKKFNEKLVLNQWLMSLFGLRNHWEVGQDERVETPFRALSDSIKDSGLEGFDSSNLHRFFHVLSKSEMLHGKDCTITTDQLLRFEENIVRHTKQINNERVKPITWKYFQWLTLLFVEIYLDYFFEKPNEMVSEINGFLNLFNHGNNTDIPPYELTDINKLSLQNATGSGKTLLMHVNLLQFRHYASQNRKESTFTRTILLTPNEDLTKQHLTEFRSSGISADLYLPNRGGAFDVKDGLNHVDVLEITKLGEEQKEKTVATRSFGDQNLLFVDEGHRGMSGKERGAWFSRRADLCSKGFTFEYSATFEQAVQASTRRSNEDSYAKSVIFDYSYRWFHEDGFGKDYLILNLPESLEETRRIYLTACLLRFYQQLRLYEENLHEIRRFNLEKPLWVFVGTTVASVQKSKGATTDVAKIVVFLADFLEHRQEAVKRIESILLETGRNTGLLDKNGEDIFGDAFHPLIAYIGTGETVSGLYDDILKRLFNCASSSSALSLNRLKGDSGEIILRLVGTEAPFGLINVGDAKGLCDHIEEIAPKNNVHIRIELSDFKEELFATVADSSSPINVLVGSKKFVEGWDCWRVSTMGLMHVGRSEGPQIVQLFGRGVRLKGYDWSLKRSSKLSKQLQIPNYLSELETLNIFGIRSDFMEKFREFLSKEGLPTDTRNKTITIPLNVTHDFGKQLKIVRARKKHDGEEFKFLHDAAAVHVGDLPDAFIQRYRVVVDRYPRIKFLPSGENSDSIMIKDECSLKEKHVFMLNYDEVFFELERYKNEKQWYNLNIDIDEIKQLILDPSWYTLYLPKNLLNFSSVNEAFLVQPIVIELLKKYCEKLYNYRKRQFFEPRLELVELTRDDWNIPQDGSYVVNVSEAEEKVIQDIQRIKAEIEQKKDTLSQGTYLQACNFDVHLYEPVLHVRPSRGDKLSIQPVSLNKSEFEFVEFLKSWYLDESNMCNSQGINDLYLLRNLSRGSGIGFFEAGSFHPDFILWLIKDEIQYVSFVEPHGLIYESSFSEKVQFYLRIKEIEERLGDQTVVLNSFVLSPTRYEDLDWEETKEELEDMHVLFMEDASYIDKLFDKILSDCPAL